MEPPGRHKADRRPGQATGGSLWPVGAHSLLQFSQPIRAGEIARRSFRLRSMAYSDDLIEHANLLVDLNTSGHASRGAGHRFPWPAAAPCKAGDKKRSPAPPAPIDSLVS